jgi:hypothetical protein
VTTHEMVLLAAADCEPHFTVPALVVAAWKRWPECFGLSGWNAHYPDSNRVVVNLYGKRGLIRRGLLIGNGTGRFMLTAAGRAAVGRDTRRLAAV